MTDLAKCPFKIYIQLRQSRSGDREETLTVEVSPDNSPDPQYYIADKFDRRHNGDFRQLTPIEQISGIGEPRPMGSYFETFGLLLVSGKGEPLSIHQSITTMPALLPRYRGMSVQIGCIQANHDLLLYDIGPGESFESVFMFDEGTATGIEAYTLDEQTILMRGQKHHSSRTTDWPCQYMTPLVRSQFQHVVPTTKKRSPFRFYLHENGKPHSLHQDLSTVAIAIDNAAKVGGQLTMRNAKGQEIQL